MLTATTATLRARWVFPVEGLPIQDGVVRVANSRIVSVGEYAPGETVTDLGDIALLPALINAHTHLEFSLLEQPLGRPGMPFADWIGEVVAFRRNLIAAGTDMSEYAAHAAEAGLQESAEAGVVAIGEIAAMNGPRQPFEACTTLRGTLFLELLGLSAEKMDPLYSAAVEHVRAKAVGSFRRGLSPHAPYTVHPDLLKKICQLSTEQQVPLAMHLAESLEELELLRSHSGPLVERLNDLSAWYPGSLPRGIRPINYLEMLSTAHQLLVIHGSFLSREEMDFLAARRAKMTVVYCPRTQAYFPHGPYPLTEMLARGARVAVGTDSRASNPDLSVLAELAQIARVHVDISPAEILKMGTLDGAEALAQCEDLGSIAPGKWAAFATVPLMPDDSRPDPGSATEMLLERICALHGNSESTNKKGPVQRVDRAPGSS